ncbi:MAG: glycosyltransferase family 39 protein [Candidatus Levybacteria bacterium]|nr:glycosyltransferase family 39 protein [Candidatus Levybacteria bacterium]
MNIRLPNKKILFLIIAFFASRLYFLNANPIFFDSPEYLRRLANPEFLTALYSGHLPLHAGYILFFWPVFHFGQILSFNPSVITVIIQIILSFLTVLAFYKFCKFILGSSKAWFSTIIISILPLYWITNVTLMMETTYIAFFIFSLYFLSRYVTSKKSSNAFMLLSLISFLLSFTTHIIVLLWIPFLCFFLFMYQPKKIIPYAIYLFLTIITASIINGYFISLTMQTNLLKGIELLYFSKLGEHASISLSSSEGIFVILRNLLIPLLRNNTFLIVALSVLSLVLTYKRNAKIFILCALWIAPSIIANQWWDSLFYGRHALIASFALAFVIGYVINKKVFAIIIIYLLFVSLPAMNLLKYETPYQREIITISQLETNGVLIESHFARPQVDRIYEGTVIFVDEPGWKTDQLDSQIQNAIANNKPVYVSSQALSEPYGLFSGPYLHTLSLSYKKDYVLKKTLSNFTLKKTKQTNYDDDLSMYQVTSNNPSPYPHVPVKMFDKRRMDFTDPFMQIWFFIKNYFNINYV